MTREEAYEVWAPPDSIWAAWAKPVLFTQMTAFEESALEPLPLPECELGWTGRSGGPIAVVVNLPALAAVAWGLALAGRGFRPVPLFNAAAAMGAVLNYQPLIDALRRGVANLRGARLPADAPPAFLLDAHRTPPGLPPRPGTFDNRWVVFPQDLPSGPFLRSHGIEQAVVIQEGTEEIPDDLRHVLRRWQESGLPITLLRTDGSGGPTPVQVTAPSGFRRMWHRALVMLRYRRNSAGGFGAAVPQQATGSGYH